MRWIIVPRGFLHALLLTLVWLLPATANSQTILVQPYVQPGDGRFLTGTDVKVICWWTDQQPGEFVVEYDSPGGPVTKVKPARTTLDFAAFKTPSKPMDDKKKDTKEPKLQKVPLPPEQEQHYFKYTAKLDGLPFTSTIDYRVKLGDRVIRAASFHTRATPDKTARCILVGDLAYGMTKEKEVAYQMSKQMPDFFVALGDICYPEGRLNQYMNHFFSTYNNVTEANPKTGAPLMASVPFYAVVGTHDVDRAKLPAVPDAFGAYYVFCPPKGGPGEGPWITQLGEDKAAADKFRAVNADSYPYLSDYSFDYGAAHFTIINANKSLDLAAPAFRKWLTDDLKSTKAKWKIVCFHMPGFHSTVNHYMEQQVRLLQPIFEEGGVHLTFAGHVHNYQRTVPLKFTPQGAKDAKGKVNGKFTLDTKFDGVKNTKPSGVIHIVSGGGGARLYGPGLDETAPMLRKDHADNYADFTAKLVADEHSFAVLDIAPDHLQLRALGVAGNELDSITIR